MTEMEAEKEEMDTEGNNMRKKKEICSVSELNTSGLTSTSHNTGKKQKQKNKIWVITVQILV